MLVREPRLCVLCVLRVENAEPGAAPWSHPRVVEHVRDRSVPDQRPMPSVPVLIGLLLAVAVAVAAVSSRNRNAQTGTGRQTGIIVVVLLVVVAIVAYLVLAR